MSPLLPSRPAGRVRLLVLGLLLAVAGLLVAPSGAAAADPAATADRLTTSLGAQGAGAYLDASGRLTVNVLSAGAAAQVRAAGAAPRLVTRSLPGWSGSRRPWTPPGLRSGPAGALTCPPTPCS